ncbi:MAG: hypothetical protein ACOX5G_08425 [Kiritimatiellia bacterium]|jgi:hypothetical protein
MKKHTLIRFLAAVAATIAVTTAAHAALTGVTINGTPLDDAVSTNGPGWAYDSSTLTLTLSGAGPFTLSGRNTAGAVRILVPQGATNTVTLSNLTLSTGYWSDNFCAIELETGANVSLSLKGRNSIESRPNRAGLEVPLGASLSITHAPDDDEGALFAAGGSSAAGIGGGKNGACGTVTITGGIVAAEGGSYGSGIGGGCNGAGGTVDISGGIVTATAGQYGSNGGAGIGGGGGFSSGGASAAVTISGGTVFAQGNGGSDIGPGYQGVNAGATTFTGGSIRLGGSFASPAPSNGTAPVFCAVVTGFEPREPVAIAGLANYNGDDIAADDYGCIYLWLPDGTRTFQANGSNRTVKIQNGVGPTGVTVNGEEIASPAGSPTGWSFNAATRSLAITGSGTYTLSGANVIGGVGVAVAANLVGTVTLSNLTLLATHADQCAFVVGTNANVSLALAGTNTLASGSNRAGLEVAAGRTLSITNAPGDDAGSLSASGGDNAAGIGRISVLLPATLGLLPGRSSGGAPR